MCSCRRPLLLPRSSDDRRPADDARRRTPEGLRGALSGIGLLKSYAGSVGQDGDLEYVAIIDTRADKVVSIEPERWGSKNATWTWEAVSVVVTDPDGHSNEVALRKERRSAPVARRRDDGGFFGQQQQRRQTRRGTGGGSPGMLDWLFR